jgi:DNA invertase Pin-like site-specific DNA recombinase
MTHGQGGEKLKKVTKIAQQRVDSPGQAKQRVAAYCRVSTDRDDQLVSLDTQIKHYESHIKANPDWTFAGLYIDEGITGTKKKKRAGLRRMMIDCEQRKLDLILTKSISRFARNTTECLELVRTLTTLNIFIYFEKENIHTGSMESELMLSILSGLAESESTSLAENSRWSVTRRFQNGTYKISCPPYGYDAVDGKLIVNEIQADIVRFIFTATLSGTSTHTLAKDLNYRKVPTKRGGNWTSTTIRGMIGNEAYTGDVRFQKTYTDASFTRHRNHGEKDQYVMKNHHEAIVSNEEFEAAQRIIEQRGKEKGVEKHRGKYQNRYPFSGKIICGSCGGTFKRRIHSSGRHRVAWCCKTHIMDTQRCAMKYIPESAMETAFVTMMNKLIFGHKIVLKPLFERLCNLNAEDALKRMQELEQKRNENAEQQKVLVNLMSKGYLEPAVYKKSANEMHQEAGRLARQQESLTRLYSQDAQNLSEVRELLQVLTKVAMLQRFDETLFSRFVRCIRVCARTEIGFELTCGITLKERWVT